MRSNSKGTSSAEVLIIISLITAAVLFISSAFASAATRKRTRQICGEIPATTLKWSDSTEIVAKELVHTSNAICGGLLQCDDETRRLLDSKPKIRFAAKEIPFTIKVSDQCVLENVQPANQEIGSTFVQSVNSALIRSTKIASGYCDGNIYGKFISDSSKFVGDVQYDRFVKRGATASIPLKCINDSIARIGGRTPESILSTIRLSVNSYKTIYQSYLDSGAMISGPISVKFQISPNGKIFSLEKLSQNINCSRFEDEVFNSIKLMKFEERKHYYTTVTYRFVFDRN